MNPPALLTFLHGALAASSWLSGLFFFRFWRSSGDRLFVFFFLAFWALAIDWTALALVPRESPQSGAMYLIRLVAFALIVVGVVDKNRRAT